MKHEEDWKGSVDENIRFGLVEVWVLTMLSKEDMYAYQVKQELDKFSGGALRIRDCSLYGPMYRMLDRGLITSRRKVVGEKRFRNYFHLEPSGREYLEYALMKFREIYGFTGSVISEYYTAESGAAPEDRPEGAGEAAEGTDHD